MVPSVPGLPGPKPGQLLCCARGFWLPPRYTRSTRYTRYSLLLLEKEKRIEKKVEDAGAAAK
jgi:hypothetical protein